MLSFLKKLFKEEKQVEQETISLNTAAQWVETQAAPRINQLKEAIAEQQASLQSHIAKARENLEALEKADLQNPNIPNKVKVIMQGNRETFVRTTTQSLNTISLEYTDFYHLLERCKELKEELNRMGNSLTRPSQIVGQFFARELSEVGEAIKQIELTPTKIEKLVADTQVKEIDQLHESIEQIFHKIKTREDLQAEIAKQEKELASKQESLKNLETQIGSIKSSDGYKAYLALQKKHNSEQEALKALEAKVFSDFLSIDRALKKYSKIAIDNQALIEQYIDKPMQTLAQDIELKIVVVLEQLKNALVSDKLGLDAKKSQKMQTKIAELSKEYLEKQQKNYLARRTALTEAQEASKKNAENQKLTQLGEETTRVQNSIESVQRLIDTQKVDLAKIDVSELKKELGERISKIFAVDITVA